MSDDRRMPQTEYLRRCAWCDKSLIRGDWIDEEDLSDDVELHAIVTHTICARCMEELRRSGRSV